MADAGGDARIEVRVTGRVHGVGFRYFVLQEAHALGLLGWVANVSDGSLQCVAEGPREDLDRLVARLREGPPSAIVEDVHVTSRPPTGEFVTFGVRSGAHRGD